MSTEKIHFKIGLSGTYWSRQPRYRVLINDRVMHEDTVTAPSDTPFDIEFDYDFVEGNEYSLKIRLENKMFGDTVENEDKTAIVKDMLLNIESIEVDEIDLGHLKHSASIYTPDDPSIEPLDNCVNLGHNGTYELKFTSPFYIWLLENL